MSEERMLRIKKGVEPGSYIGTAVEVLNAVGKIQISAMGAAILTCCDVSKTLESIGYPRASTKLETIRSEKGGKKYSTSRLEVTHTKSGSPPQ